MASLRGFLKACAEAERLVGRFYGDLAERFRFFPAAEVFRRLADDEEEHARAFEFLRSIASRLDEQMVVAPAFYGNLERLRRGLEEATASLSGAGDERALREAVRVALRVETTAIERDKAAFAQVDDREFRNLLNALVGADEAHHRRLKELWDGLPPAEVDDVSRQSVA